MRIAIVGGVQGRPAGVADRAHEPLYSEGRVVILDTEDGAERVALSHRMANAPDTVGHAFKSATVDATGFAIPSEREVLRWRPGAPPSVASHPWFSDLHHALPGDGGVWLAASALDAVLFARDDGSVDYHPLDRRARPPEGDVRFAPRTRRWVHPNHLTQIDGEVWATRFHQRDLARVADPSDVIDVGGERLHDGRAIDGHLWFTEIDGHVVVVDPGLRRVVRRIDVQPERVAPGGWCRGLAVVGNDLFVAFTRLRATRWRAHLAWTRRLLSGTGGASTAPSRIERFDIRTGARTGIWPVTQLDALFSLHAEPDLPAGLT